jgi:heat shock protein HslJ
MKKMQSGLWLLVVVVLATIASGRAQTAQNKSQPAQTMESSNFANVPLKDTHWTLISLNGTDVAADSKGKKPFLVLDSKSRRVTGNGGCNRLTGKYEEKSNRLTFGEMASSMATCPTGMDTEKAFTQALEKVTNWKITEQELDLFDASGKSLARFEAVQKK